MSEWVSEWLSEYVIDKLHTLTIYPTCNFLPESSLYSECMGTVKPVLFACPLFHKFRDLGNFAKIMGCKYIYLAAVY